MAWLEKIDTRARRWPRPAFWCYFLVKWYLVATGVIVAVGLCFQELHRGIPALGTGIVVAGVGGTIKGLSEAWARGWRPRLRFPLH